MRPATLLVLVALGLITLPTSRAAEANGYSFTLDGSPIQPQILSLCGTPDRPQAGDLVRIDDLLPVLGPPDVYQFRRTPAHDGRLLRVGKDGRTEVVGAKVTWTYQDDKKVITNPLSRLAADELPKLRGVRLDEWDDQIRAIGPPARSPSGVRRPDGQHSPPAGRHPAAVARRPRLPGGGGALQFRHPRLLASAAAESPPLPRGAEHDWPGGQQRPEASCTIARYLDLRGSRLRNAEALAPLKELRYLDLGYTRGVTAVSFAAGMGSLVHLDLQRTAVADLAPLAGLKSLAEINANRAPVRSLPKQPLPGLRQLQVMSTALSDEGVTAFSARHPGCQVVFRWEQALRQQLQGVTRVRVRTGGTCHRDPRTEKTLFEEKNEAAVRKLIRGICVDEAAREFHCMCRGNPSIEFYQGNELKVTLGFHHGRSVRWPNVWPGTALSRKPAPELLCQWLAEHGFRGPLEERQKQKKQDLAMRRRVARYDALIPAPVLKDLKAAKSAEEAVKAFRDGTADERARAALYLPAVRV